MSLRADVVPSSLDAEKRTVDVVWTTGARVMRGFFDQYWEELSLDPKHVRMGRLGSGAAPLLNSHNADDLSSVIGVVETASLQKTKGIATVRFARDPISDGIFQKVSDGIIKNVSVGYRVQKLEKVAEAEGKIPVFRATDWEPHEISMVPIGADAAAVTRADATTNPCEFIQEHRTMDPETTNPPAPTVAPLPNESPAVTATRAAQSARVENAKAIAAAAQSAAEEATKEERQRMAEIRKLAKQSRLGEAWATSLIEAGTPVAEARRVAFDQLVETDDEFQTDPAVRIGAGDDERDKWIRGASAWLWQRTGTRALVEAAKAKNPELFKDVSFDPGEFRGYSPLELARMSLERGRVSTRGMDTMRMVGMAFTHRTLQTTSDFAILLENVLSKVLLGAYATQVNTWERFCKTDEVPDFRNSNRYRTGSLPGLDVILEHGEYKSGIIPDGAKYGISTQRMGKMFGLTREVIVNDDMGALTDMATGLGKAAMRTIENSVYALLALNSGLGPTQTDTQPFFHANRANVSTGAALSVAAIDADRVTMRAQKDPNGLDFLDLQPKVLLVPDSLWGAANEINKSEFDFDNAGTNTTGKFMRPNRVRGLFSEVVSSPRLTGTRRYLFAETMDAIVVAFLAGYGKGPVIDSQQGWRIDGVEWKVTIYAKAQMGDPKAAITNAGV